MSSSSVWAAPKLDGQVQLRALVTTTAGDSRILRTQAAAEGQERTGSLTPMVEGPCLSLYPVPTMEQGS